MLCCWSHINLTSSFCLDTNFAVPAIEHFSRSKMSITVTMVLSHLSTNTSILQNRRHTYCLALHFSHGSLLCFGAILTTPESTVDFIDFWSSSGWMTSSGMTSDWMKSDWMTSDGWSSSGCITSGWMTSGWMTSDFWSSSGCITSGWMTSDFWSSSGCITSGCMTSDFWSSSGCITSDWMTFDCTKLYNYWQHSITVWFYGSREHTLGPHNQVWSHVEQNHTWFVS